MGSDCWNGFFRETRKGILSANNFFRLRQLLFDGWVACANLLQFSTHSALASFEQKGSRSENNFSSPESFVLAPHLFGFAGLDDNMLSPGLVLLRLHLFTFGPRAWKAQNNFSELDFFGLRGPRSAGWKKLFEP